MKKILAALFIAVSLTLFTPSVAQATEGCVINILGVRVCGELLSPLPTVTVTVRPQPEQVPGPVRRVPGPTVRVPGPTVTLPAPPRPTRTVTLPPEPARPAETITETLTVSPEPTRQPTPGRDTVTPSREVLTETKTEQNTVVEKVAVGAAVTFALAALGIFALFLGYLLGQRDAKKNEEKFIDGLLDVTRIRKRS